MLRRTPPASPWQSSPTAKQPSKLSGPRDNSRANIYSKILPGRSPPAEQKWPYTDTGPRRSPWQRSRRHSGQVSYRMEDHRPWVTCPHLRQWLHSHRGGQERNPHLSEGKLGRSLAKRAPRPVHLQDYQEAHQRCSEEIQEHDPSGERGDHSGPYWKDRLKGLPLQDRGRVVAGLPVRIQEANSASYAAGVSRVRRTQGRDVVR